MHRVQIPDMGETLRERLTVPSASLAFGCLRFTILSPLLEYLFSFEKCEGGPGTKSPNKHSFFFKPL
jgi:hypothetical protein